MDKKLYETLPHIQTGDANVDVVMQKMAARVKMGKKKYGVTTERTDLSTVQWVEHLQEELMDGAVYCQKLLKKLGKLQDFVDGKSTKAQ